MLAALSGDEHISCFSTIVKAFLNSFDANIYIMTIPTTTPATPSPIVQIIDPAGSPHSTIPTHKVLHVAFDNGELYVLDLNSAKFGTHNSLSTYSEYTRAHMGERGTLPAQLSPLNGDVSDLDMESLVTSVYLGIHMRIREAVNEWQIESGISVADMLRVVKVEEYENLKKDILMRCAKKLEWHMKRLGVKQIEDVVEWNGGA
ncbi:hypothetical protein B0J14DRAFT_662638 [Halenospora varia]|nr:hypothetical protein B0J14DRAFT_662638 [Halenospora varia]